MSTKLRPETTQMLAGFEKRMKFISIARFLTEYPAKSSIAEMIPDRDILNNIIVMVLVFIKERTLAGELDCKLQDVEEFLDEIAPILPEDCKVDAAALAKFIVTDVLQKGGALTSYKTYFSGRESFEAVPIRLLEEESGTYHLTDDAFDFLFRSKEIESELDYSVTRFRMAEYMKRDNYVKALDQSRELVSRIRSMKLSMDDFVRSCRENIARISVDQYETVISRVRNLLETEYEELKVIQDSARARSDRLAMAAESGVGTEEIVKHRKALAEIIRNIQMTIEEQRSLINKKFTLSEAYQSILSDSYAMTRYERLNFDRDILSLFRNGSLPLDEAATGLLYPLIKPEFEKQFSIENFYGMQGKLSDLECEEADAFGEEIVSIDPVEVRNRRFLEISRAWFDYMKDKTEFTVSAFFASLSDERLYEFCEESSLMQVMMILYEFGEISISKWKAAEKMIVEPLGEFDLSWCLSILPEECLEIDSFTVTKMDRAFSFTLTGAGGDRRISMSDFRIAVKQAGRIEVEK